MPEHGGHSELIEGQLRVMEPGNFEHGRVASTADRLLSTHVHATGSGVTLAAETGFVLATEPDTVRAPDAAFVSQARVDAIGITERFWPGGAPDLAIEVVSPEDSRPYVRAKALNWLETGATAVLVLDPRTCSATVYRAGRRCPVPHRGHARPQRRGARLARRGRRLLRLTHAHARTRTNPAG